MSVELRLDPGAFARLLRLRTGRAGRRLAERTERVARIAEREAPGRMGRTIRWRVEETSTGLQGVITCDHPAVFFVLDGTRAHVIRPRRAKALRFAVRGRTVFAAYVKHPGTRPNPFLQRALRQGR